MNRDDIMNMPAGREMDKKIAFMVFPEAKRFIYYPQYSANPTFAFDALYAWLDAHPEYAVHIETVNITTGRLHDVILWGMDADPIYDARAETLPLAICRILLATMSDE